MQRQASVGIDSAPLPMEMKFDGLRLAQVVDIIPEEHAVQVILQGLSVIKGVAGDQALKVLVMEHRAGPWAGDSSLPRVGDMGVVSFLHGSDQLGVWLGSVHQAFNNIVTTNRDEELHHHDSGVWKRIDGAGNSEWSHPSGTFITVGGAALSARTRHERQGQTRRTVPYSIPALAAPVVRVHHSTGTDITIAANGDVTLSGFTNVTLQGDDIVLKSTNGTPGNHCHVGGSAGEDYIALLAALTKIKASFDTHVHSGVLNGGSNTAVPTAPLTPFVADTDYTQQSKAT